MELIKTCALGLLGLSLVIILRVLIDVLTQKIGKSNMRVFKFVCGTIIILVMGYVAGLIVRQLTGF